MDADVIGVNKDVIEVNNGTDIGHICKDIVHKMLKCGRTIRESEGHDQPFKQSISGLKHHFPFIALGDSD